MATIDELTKEVASIKQRNELVEKDKEWETSYTRRILLFLFTYLAVGLYLNVIEVKNPWTSAIVPAIGFLLSTLSLPLFRKLWEKYLS